MTVLAPALLALTGCVLSPDTPSPGATRPDTGTSPSTTEFTRTTAASTGDTAPTPTATTSDSGSFTPMVIVDEPSLRILQDKDPTLAGIGGMIAVLDFLDDAGLEVVTGNTTGPTYVWSVAGERGERSGHDLLRFTLEGGHLGVLSRDLDGDGRSDLLQHDGFLDGLWTVHPSPYDPATAFTLYDIRGHWNSTCVADLDGDEVSDLMLLRDGGAVADVFFGPFVAGEYRGEADVRDLVFDQRHNAVYLLCPGDITGDGVPDLLNVGGSVAIYDAALQRDTTELTGASLLPFKHTRELPYVIDHPTQPDAQALWVAGDFPYAYRLVTLPLTQPDEPEVIALVERQSDASARFADVDGDLVTDLIVTRDGDILVHFGPIVGQIDLDDFDLEVQSGMNSLANVQIEDIDLDGIDDLILAGERGTQDQDEIHVYYGPLPRPGEVWTP